MKRSRRRRVGLEEEADWAAAAAGLETSCQTPAEQSQSNIDMTTVVRGQDLVSLNHNPTLTY